LCHATCPGISVLLLSSYILFQYTYYLELEVNKGLNIAGFHVHVDIADKGVVAGDLLQLTVTDGNSKSTTAQKSITEEEDED
jgi:hypothetical protein